MSLCLPAVVSWSVNWRLSFCLLHQHHLRLTGATNGSRQSSRGPSLLRWRSYRSSRFSFSDMPSFLSHSHSASASTSPPLSNCCPSCPSVGEQRLRIVLTFIYSSPLQQQNKAYMDSQHAPTGLCSIYSCARPQAPPFCRPRHVCCRCCLCISDPLAACYAPPSIFYVLLPRELSEFLAGSPPLTRQNPNWPVMSTLPHRVTNMRKVGDLK